MANPKKIATMLDWPILTNIKSLRGFLGLTGYYYKFIKSYGSIVASLTNLLKKNSFLRTEKATQAFLELKEAIIKPPVLRLPKFSSLLSVMLVAEG